MSEVEAVIVGVVIGGVLGVASTFVGSYLGPLQLEKKREQRKEREYQPRKELLQRLLTEHPNMPIRSLERLQLVTGTTDEECRRLLIEVDARGVKMKGGREGWALIDRYGFDRPDGVEEDPAVV
jgi:hypothetical protein